MKNLRSMLITGAAVGAAAIGGGAIASAASSSSTTSGSGSGTASGTRPARPNMPAPGTAAHENAEKTVTGTAADKAKAAAIKAAGGGTAGTVTTDFTGNGYEVTVTKSDGSKVEIHLDKSFDVMRGPGGPGMPGGPHMSGAAGMPGSSGMPGGYGASGAYGAPSTTG